MKPFDALTRSGRLRRLRQLAQAALPDYGLATARLVFLHYEGNVIFRVDAPGSNQVQSEASPYVANRYALRIHTTGDTQAIASELTWLAALRREAGLPVPEPVPTVDGKLLVTMAIPGVPRGRHISLMRWLDGRVLTTGMSPDRARAWGRLVAQMHKFSMAWQPPTGFKRPHWDWKGQLGGGVLNDPTDELVASMPEQFQQPFQIVSRQVREVTEGFGKGRDAYGMIHGDLYPENLLFKGEEVYPIDFDDCGFGYWIWDIAVALSWWPWTEEWHWIRDAFLDGYAQIRSMPESQLAQLDLFMAAQYATMVLWASAFIKRDPAMQSQNEKWRDKNGKNLLRYFEFH